MVHQPNAKHNRKKSHSHSRIHAKQEAEQEIDHSSDDHISSQGEIVAAGGCDYELGGTDQKHDDAGQDAQCNITFHRESEYCDAEDKAEDARKHHEPPVLHCTADSICQIFKMTFHGTNN